LLAQAQKATVSSALFQTAAEPGGAHALAERGQLRIEAPLDVRAGDPTRQGSERSGLAALRTEPIPEAEAISLVDLMPSGNHRARHDFVFQRRHAERPLAAIRLGDVVPAAGRRSVRLAVAPAMEVVETLLQVLPLCLPGRPSDSWGGITLARAVGLPHTGYPEVVA